LHSSERNVLDDAMGERLLAMAAGGCVQGRLVRLDVTKEPATTCPRRKNTAANMERDDDEAPGDTTA